MKNTTRKKKEKILMELTKRASDQSSNGIIITNAKLDEDKAKILYTNEKFCEMTGYNYEELIGETLNKLHGPKTDPQILTQRKMKLSKGSSFNGKLIKYRKDGSEFYNECDSAPVFNTKGEITNYLYVMRDVSQQILTKKNKEERVSVVSHELKTPLTAINGFVEILEKNIEKNNADKNHEYLEIIKAEIERLAGLTQELLETAPVKPPGVKPDKHPSDIDQIIRQVIRKIKSTTNSHKIKKRGRIGKLITCDKDRIMQVITNLLTNAIEYSPDAEQVVVFIKRENNNAIVSIQDFGIGIPSDKQEKIFEPIFNETEKGQPVRSGLGLSIAAEIVRNHGGKIWLESIEGKGSVFSFCLPLS